MSLTCWENIYEKNRLYQIDKMEVREEGGNLEKQALFSLQPEGEISCNARILQLFFKLKLLLQSALDYLEFQTRAVGLGECTTKCGFLRALSSSWDILGHCFAELFHGLIFHYCTLFYHHIPYASVECHTCATSRLMETDLYSSLLSATWDSERAAQ